MLEYPPPIFDGTLKVSFFGPMASGKTFAAQNLVSRYQKMSLAGPLKTTAKEYYGVTGKTNDERQILQELADDLKKWDNDVFTKRLLWDVYNYQINGGADPIIVDDMRFTHEANDLRDHGFILVRVYVPEETRMARIAEKYPDTDPSRFQHRSEKDWKDIKPDFTVLGDGTEGLESLKEALQYRV